MPTTSNTPYASRGFSLVEIMIGILIGMISSLVVLQMFMVSEEQKRTITEGDSALVSGAIALDILEREIHHSGYGAVANYNVLGCNLLLPSGVTLNTMVPVTINPAGIPAGDANTDRILVVYGNGPGATEEVSITAQPSTAVYAVDTPTSFAIGDLVIAENGRPSPCTLRLDTVTGVSSPNVTVQTGVSGMANGRLYNVGRADQEPQITVYAIRGGNLTACDYLVSDCGDASQVSDTAVWVPIANNIVSLRAEYGRDDVTTSPARDSIVDLYDQTVEATADPRCGWARIGTVRLVVVARSPQYETAAVTTAAPTWSGSGSTPISLTGNTDWQHYRYKLFETHVSLRNIAWMRVLVAC